MSADSSKRKLKKLVKNASGKRTALSFLGLSKDKLRDNQSRLQTLRYKPVSGLLVTILALISGNIAAVYLLYVYAFLTGMNSSQMVDWVNTSAYAQFWLLALTSLITAGFVYWFLRSKKQPVAQVGLKKPRWQELIAGVVSFLPYLVVLSIAVALFGAFIKALDVNQPQEIFTASTGGFKLILAFVPLVLLSPVIEEFIFRGFLYSAMRKKFSFVATTLIISAIFGSLHLSGGTGGPLWVAAIDTTLLSFFLCYLRERTGSIWAGVALHVIKNLVAFLGVFVFTN